MRKVYLYSFLFVATATVLSSVVFIVYRVLSWILGSDAPSLDELGQVIAFSVIAVGVWLYHGCILRSDRKLTKRDQVKDLEDRRMAIVDTGDGRFGAAVVEALKQRAPGVDLELIVLTQPGAVVSDEDVEGSAELTTRLERAGLIVGPWMIAVPGGAGGAVSLEVARAVASSPAHKLLVPVRSEGWEWAGVDRRDTRTLIRRTVRAIEQIAAQEEPGSGRSLGVGAIIGVVLGALLLLPLLVGLILALVEALVY